MAQVLSATLVPYAGVVVTEMIFIVVMARGRTIVKIGSLGRVFLQLKT